MELLRNREIRAQLIISAVLTVLFAAAAVIAVSIAAVSSIAGTVAGILVLILGIALTAVQFAFLRKRYALLTDMSSSIDRILHGQESVFEGASDEGELAILQSEIQKMTVRLREQADMLVSEKVRLSDAIADMFHQMRTPITSMKLQLSLLDSDDLSGERRLELTRSLKTQVERLQWLTETLLKMSKIDAGTAGFRKDPVSVKALIDKAAGPFLIPMELRDQRLVIQAGGESFSGDLAWTAEALGNLIKNCMEHTPAGGSVTVSALETALYTQITVTDTGSGFAPEDIPYLFERFYRGSNATDESIGIGLALSRAIISGQGGTITAENAPDGGARFIIRFYKSVV
ncbi:MAG: HAMP domain-containing histidine kinase [Firmicutes bacterium]|nr:HAMP domain-containing histidine kinase [Bacillota bacterium]